jgi:hypothetical protein
VLTSGGEKVALRQVARLTDIANFGPRLASGIDTPDQARPKRESFRTQSAQRTPHAISSKKS